MPNIWSSIRIDISTPPHTLDDAVRRLLLILSNEERLTIAAMDQDDLIDLHFSLGAAIRNAFDLHKPDNPLSAQCAMADPDDASTVIIQALWQQLQ